MTYKTPEQIARAAAGVADGEPLSPFNGAYDAALKAAVMVNAQSALILEREANILDDYRRTLKDGRIPPSLDHNMSRVSEAMRLASGWNPARAMQVSFDLPSTTPADRVAAWIDVYEANSPWADGDRTGASYESAPLLLSDLKALVEAAR